MTFAKALAQLQQWCAESHGEPLPGLPDGRGVFESRSIHTEDELNTIEERLRCTLPQSYRQFMKTIGASSLFCTHVTGGGPIFYRPDEILHASANASFEDENGSVNRFCFVGEHRSMGDFMGFLISRPGPRNFDVFCHEYPFEEYVSVSNEINSWRTFDEWLIHAVETEGVESI
jgi:hypothetical protein